MRRRMRSSVACSSGGRNSCSGGSRSRIVTGKPVIASKIASKSPCCIGSSLSRAARRPSSFAARIISRTTGSRSSAMNMCSVRQRPIPCAPKSRALAASAGVSAFARTCSRRCSSPQPRTVSRSSFTCGGTSGTSPMITAPVPPSMVRTSPSDRVWPCSVIVRASTSIASASQPATHGFPIPRATTAACDVMPPCAVSTPAAWISPWMSSGVVSQRTRITCSPARPRCSAVSASSTILPLAAPGEAFRPLAATSHSAVGSIIGCSSWSSCWGSMRATASSRLISASSTMSTAALTDAAAVRFAERVCRRKRSLSSTVNSMSCMSR